MRGACMVRARYVHGMRGACMLHAWYTYKYGMAYAWYKMAHAWYKYGTCVACRGSEARMVAEDRAKVLARRTEHEDLVVGRVAHEEPS